MEALMWVLITALYVITALDINSVRKGYRLSLWEKPFYVGASAICAVLVIADTSAYNVALCGAIVLRCLLTWFEGPIHRFFEKTRKRTKDFDR